jgi:hypothetical protein
MSEEEKAIATKTHKRIVIFINDDRLEAPDDEMTGSELLALAGLPSANAVFLEVPGPGEDRAIGHDEVVALKSGMKFYDVPVGTFG